MPEIQLDHAATTPVRREALEAMWPYLTGAYGNPSSRHRLGEEAARALDDARERVAAVLGARPAEVVFTSGGTEADNLAVKGLALANARGRHVLVAATEHEAVLESADHLERMHGFAVDRLPVDAHGRLAPASLRSSLRGDSTLVSVMLANNEIGTVQPIAELAEVAHAVGARFHSDAVQAAGWLPLDVEALGVDALTISGHKVGAPKGVGALYLRRGARIEPVMHGGGQERGRRSGTEDVAGAVGLAVALELAEHDRRGRADAVERMRDAFIRSVLAAAPEARLTGHPVDRLAANASFCFPGTAGEAVLLQLEERGVLCSSGSACAAGSDEPSHVLTALGLDDATAQTAVRFTLAATTTEAELEQAVLALRASLDALRGLATR